MLCKVRPVVKRYETRSYTGWRDPQIVRAALAGVPVQEVGQRFEITATRVHQIMQANGYAFERYRRYWRKVSR